MSSLDDRFERLLGALEAGQSSGQVARELRGPEEELGELLTLAAALRSIPKPRMAPSAIRAQQRRVQAVVRDFPSARAGRRPRSIPKWKIPRLATALGTGFALAVIGALVFGALLVNSFSRAQVVTLTDAVGAVEIASTDPASEWQSLSEELEIRAGQRVRTGPDASVTLVFHEGSRTSLGPGTELALSEVGGGWGRGLQVAVSQAKGSTDHKVNTLRGDQSFFHVTTPSGMARVRGTLFEVSVRPDGMARYVVESGQLAVLAEGQEIRLLSGQASATSPGQPPSAPADQFSGSGRIRGLNGDTWIIAGVPVTISGQTDLVGDPQVGDFVRVTGRILTEGAWMADEIAATTEAVETFRFSGSLNALDAQNWLVGGSLIVVDENTILDGEFSLGDRVRVTFTVESGGVWLALNIESLDRADPPTPTATADPEAQPSLSFEPDELMILGCGRSFDFAGILVNRGSPADDYAANVELGYFVSQGSQFVEAILLQPDYWQRISAGEQVGFVATIHLNESWTSAPDAEEVKVRVFIAGETNRPGQHRARLTLTVVANCGGRPNRTPSPTASMTPVGTPSTPTPITPDPIGSTNCTGANPHPTGMSLAQAFNVPYEEIIGWFCSGFGFGEIRQAYELSRESGRSAAEIFAMRRSGLGWGQIKKQLGGGPDR